ncbi:MAG: hypothetical protein ABEI57_05375 [Halapricum sp.]
MVPQWHKGFVVREKAGNMDFTRRGVFRSLIALGIGSSTAGCMGDGEDTSDTGGFGPGGPSAGDLVVDNHTSEKQTATITVNKISDDFEDNPQTPAKRTPTTSPTSVDTSTYTISGKQKLKRSGFLSEVGSYYVVAEAKGKKDGIGWIGLEEGYDDQLAGAYLHISINDDSLGVSPFRSGA